MHSLSRNLAHLAGFEIWEGFVTREDPVAITQHESKWRVLGILGWFEHRSGLASAASSNICCPGLLKRSTRQQATHGVQELLEGCLCYAWQF